MNWLKIFNKSSRQTAVVSYSQNKWLRAAIQAIPQVGGPLDTLLSETGQEIRQGRVSNYLESVEMRIEGLEGKIETATRQNPEEVYDLLRSHLSAVDKSRSSEKRSRFANILLNKFDHDWSFQDAETATRLLERFDDIHILVLSAICTAPQVPEPWGMKRVSIVEPSQQGRPGEPQFFSLSEHFQTLSIASLRLIVSELASVGLINDEGAGRFGGYGSLSKLSPLPLGEWFLNWITRT